MPDFRSFFKSSTLCIYGGIYLVSFSVIWNGMCVLARNRQAIELYFIGQVQGRLSWPFGDLTSGNYLAKVGLPSFLVMVALAVSARPNIAGIAGLLSLITLIFSILTGERINFLIRACAGMLAGLMWRPKWNRYFLLVAIEIVAVVLLFQVSPEISKRFVTICS